MRKSGANTFRYGQPRDLLSIQPYSAAAGWTQAGNRLHQFRLSVAVYTGYADNLSLMDLKGKILQPQRAQRVFDVESLYPENAGAGLLRLFFQMERHLPPHHFVRHFLRTGIRHGNGIHHRAPTNDDTPVGGLLDLLQLVGDENDRFSLPGQVADDLHQLINLPGHQYGGRLVENQNIRIPVQHLQNFCPLLHAYRNFFNSGCGVDFHAVSLGQGFHTRLRPLQVHMERTARFQTQYNVFCNSKIMNQLEVLMNHSDAKFVCVPGTFDLHRLSLNQNPAGIRAVNSHQNIHESGFSRAIFTEKSQNLSPVQLKRDMIVGPQPGKILDNILHFQNNLRIHQMPLFPPAAPVAAANINWEKKQETAPLFLPISLLCYQISSTR